MESAKAPGAVATQNNESSEWRWFLLLWGIGFALAYGQSPLFTSNQNQYFLHGLANAGYGQLQGDWLANTLDPTPVFSWLVWLVAETFPLAAFYLLYGLLLLLYFFSLWQIMTRVFDLTSTRWRRHGSALLLVLLHSAALRLLLSRALGPEAAYLLEGGVAGQRLLGAVLQPSSFGALLLASIAFFLNKRPYGAVTAAAAAAIFHPTYLPSAAALTATYIGVLYWQDRSPRKPLLVGGLALALVLPIVLYTYQLHQPTSAELWNQAAQIMIHQRIPHHALPGQWFSWTTVLKLTLLIFALDVSRRSRLGPILLFPTAIALALTLAQLLTGSHRLALLFPWRLSTWIIPMASSIALLWSVARLAEEIPRPRWTAQPWTIWLFWGLGIALAAAGLTRTVILIQRQQAEPAQALYAEVRQRLKPGHVYLIPPKLQDFRLETGAPIFVDFKAIPYRDREFLAWEERLELAQFFYRDDPALISCKLLPRIAEAENITHVVLEQDQFGVDCPGLELSWQAEKFVLYNYMR